jgi:hypothetical protein
MLRPRSHSLNWAWMTTWYYLSIYWKCWPEFARPAAGPGGCWEALIKHAPCLVPSRETGSRMCAAEVRVKPSTCHQAVCTMGTRDPLRIDCPRCKAKPGQLYKSKTRIRMCHKEGRIRSRKPKKRRSSHWGRPYPEGMIGQLCRLIGNLQGTTRSVSPTVLSELRPVRRIKSHPSRSAPGDSPHPQVCYRCWICSGRHLCSSLPFVLGLAL